MIDHWYDPPLHVLHALLRPTSSPDQGYSECSACKRGSLPFKKDGVIQERVRCIICGQPFIYDDVEHMKLLNGNFNRSRRKMSTRVVNNCRLIGDKLSTHSGSHTTP